MMVRRLLSFWDGIFSGAMLNFQGWFKIIVLPYLLGRDYFHIHDRFSTGWDRDSRFFVVGIFFGVLEPSIWGVGAMFWTQQLLKAREMRRHCHILPMFQTLLWAYINRQWMNDCMLQSMGCNGNFFCVTLRNLWGTGSKCRKPYVLVVHHACHTRKDVCLVRVRWNLIPTDQLHRSCFVFC